MERVKGLDKIISDAVVNGIFPGANYVVVSKYGTFKNSFGKKALIPLEEDNDINTLYDMASCTKVLSTTSCIMKLLEMGKLRLYDNVSKYVPDFIHQDILVWDLLTHSSGLPADVHRAAKLKSKEELFEKIFNVELKYERHSDIVYSDIGFILLGLVVESISGMPLDQFAKENVFDPLEMYHTGFNRISDNMNVDFSKYAATEKRSDEIVDEVLRGKVHDEKAYIMGGVAGHAGLFSCVEDISHFIEMVLNDGVYKGKQFFSKATIDLLFTPQIKKPKGVALDCTQRGLGWIVKGDFCAAGDLASPETIHHTGFTGTNVCIDRINKVGFSILSNRVHPTRANTLIIPFRAKVGNYIIANFGGRNE